MTNKVAFICLAFLFFPHASTESVEGDIRLVDSYSDATNQGRLEVFHNQLWGTVCDDHFDTNDAKVVCRQLGFTNGGVPKLDGTFGSGTGVIWMDDLQCSGDEQKLKDCLFAGWNISNCGHSEDVGVVCHTSAVSEASTLPENSNLIQPNNCTAATPVNHTNGDIRIIGPPGLRGNGFVEVYYNGEWGAVCDDRWGVDDAKVVCRSLCFSTANARAGTEANIESVRANVSRHYYLDDLGCDGNEAGLAECPHSGWNNSNCHGDHELALVSCVPIQEDDATFVPNPDVRCTNTSMVVSFSTEDDPHLEAKHLSLIGLTGTCGFSKVNTPTAIVLDIPLTDCGTTYSTTETHIIYSNMIKYDYTQQTGDITRRNTFNVTIFCDFQRNITANDGIAPQPDTVTQRSEGIFSMDMKFYFEYLQNPATESPVQISLGDFLYTGIHLKTEDSNLKLNVRTCTATPSSNDDDAVRYNLFHNGCKEDSTVSFFLTNDTTYAYKFQSFKFLYYERVYIHCYAIVCLSSEKSEQCDRSCASTSARRKREAGDQRDTIRHKRAADEDHDIYVVSSPGMDIRRESNNSQIIRIWDLGTTALSMSSAITRSGTAPVSTTTRTTELNTSGPSSIFTATQRSTPSTASTQKMVSTTHTPNVTFTGRHSVSTSTPGTSMGPTTYQRDHSTVKDPHELADFNKFNMSYNGDNFNSSPAFMFNRLILLLSIGLPALVLRFLSVF